jgi:RNA polymerase sigma factor (sigma-70 family)
MESRHELFEELYEAHGSGVKRFIFTQARRDAEATEDIFQNTWENVFRYLRTLKERGAAKSWIYSIAKNEAARYYSRRDRRMPQLPVSLGDDDAPDPVDEGAGAFPDMIALTDQLAGLLGGLSESEQQLMLLRYGYDMSIADIAALMDANYNTVKSVTRRATIKLRKLAETAGGER